MERLKSWWNSKSIRDRRALSIMLVVAPAILFWWSITNPLQERIKLAQRVLATKRQQATELMNVLIEYSKIKNKVRNDIIRSDTDIMPYVEKILNKLPGNSVKPSINRASIIIGGTRQNVAVITFNKIRPEILSKLFKLIANSSLIVAKLELGTARDKSGFSGKIQVWKKVE